MSKIHGESNIDKNVQTNIKTVVYSCKTRQATASSSHWLPPPSLAAFVMGDNSGGSREGESATLALACPTTSSSQRGKREGSRKSSAKNVTKIKQSNNGDLCNSNKAGSGGKNMTAISGRSGRSGGTSFRVITLRRLWTQIGFACYVSFLAFARLSFSQPTGTVVDTNETLLTAASSSVESGSPSSSSDLNRVSKTGVETSAYSQLWISSRLTRYDIPKSCKIKFYPCCL